MVVVAVNPRQPETLGVALAFLLAYLVFFPWKDVRIVIVDGGVHVILQHPFHDGAAAWRAAGVQQYLGASVFGLYNSGSLHNN
jgi:hypothetical protein